MSEKQPGDRAGIEGTSPDDSGQIDRTSRADINEHPPRLHGVDGRSAEAKRFRRIWLDLADALGRSPSPVDRTLLTDAALLVLEVERLAARAVARGERRPDADQLVRVSGALSRALERLGILNEAQPVDPKTAARVAAERKVADWRKES